MNPKQRALVVADGRFQRELKSDVRLVVRKAEPSAVFVRLGVPQPSGGLAHLRETERGGL